MADPVLTATISGSKKILLSWTYDSNADFQVFWKKSRPTGSDFVLLATTNEFSYTTADLESAITYSFYVRANVGATFFYSNVVELFVSCGKGVVLTAEPPDPPEPQFTGDLFATCDTDHNIAKFNAGNLSLITKIGSWGSGNDNFKTPTGITAHGEYIYIADRDNNRIVKRRADDLSYVSQVSSGLSLPTLVETDGIYLYVGDRGHDRIVKYDLDFNYITAWGEFSTDPEIGFINMQGIATDGSYVWITNSGNGIMSKLRCSDLVCIDSAQYLFWQTVDTNAYLLAGMHCYGNYIYACNFFSHAHLIKFRKSDMQVESFYGSSGTGDDQFDVPYGNLGLRYPYLFVPDSLNARIKIHNLSDFAFVRKQAMVPIGISRVYGIKVIQASV